MLRIEIPSDGQSGLNFSKLEKYDIPAPSSGFDQEVNNNVVMLFENEQEAIDYAQRMDEYAESISDNPTPTHLVIRDIIDAISNDSFVQSYIQS